MMGNWRKKPQSKQNINPVGFPPIPPSMIWRVDCFLDSAPKQAEAFPMGDNPKSKRNKRTKREGASDRKRTWKTEMCEQDPQRGQDSTSGRRVRKKNWEWGGS